MDRVGADYPDVADPKGDFVTALGLDVPVPGYPISLAVSNGRIEAVHVGPFHSVTEIEKTRGLVGDQGAENSDEPAHHPK